MPRLIASQVRLLVGLWLLTMTMHCLQLVRFVGETASTAPASTKLPGVADADVVFAPETSGEHTARTLKVRSAKSAKRIGRRARTLFATMIVSSLLLYNMFPVIIRPDPLLGRPG